MRFETYFSIKVTTLSFVAFIIFCWCTFWRTACLERFAGPWPRACQITGLWKETIRKETSRFHKKMHIFFKNGFRNYPLQEKGSETDPEMSTCCCFLLKQLFLVQTARTRGGLSGSPGPWSQARAWLKRHPFLNNLLEPFVQPIFLFDENLWVWTAPARTGCIWAHPLEHAGWRKIELKKQPIS